MPIYEPGVDRVTVLGQVSGALYEVSGIYRRNM